MDHSLTPADHTLVMKAVFDRPLNIIHHLETPRGTEPTPEQVLDAMLKVQAFDAETKAVLQQVRDLHPQLEAAKAQIPQATMETVEGIIDRVRGKSVDGMLAVLSEEQQRNVDLAPALEAAAEILRDGADTIYSPDYAPAEYLRGRTADLTADAAGEAIGTADVVGAIVGAIGSGSVTGGLAAPVGAAAGAASASAAGALTVLAIEFLS